MRLFPKLDGALNRLDFSALLIQPFSVCLLGGYNIYRGLGGIEQVDWETPVAYLRPDQPTAVFEQPLHPGLRYVYAARAVSQNGLEERNTRAFVYVEVDAGGNLLPAPLDRPYDLSVEITKAGELLVGFSYHAPFGFAQAEAFEILSDRGSGILDLDNPITTVSQFAPGQSDFEVLISRPESSLLLAVRPTAVGRTGPTSEVMRVPLPAPPVPAAIF